MPVGVKVCDECGSPLAASAVPTVVSVLGERQRILMGPPRTGRSVAGVLSVPEGLRPRGKRFWWLAGGVFGAIAVAGCIIGATWLMSSGPEPTSVPSASPVAPSVVTLPGFDTAPTWSADRVVSASAAGTRVAGVVDGTATLWVARTGEVLAVSPITGEGAETVAGSVAGVPALAVATDTQALVWVGESVDPLVIALDGARRVTVRSGGCCSSPVLDSSSHSSPRTGRFLWRPLAQRRWSLGLQARARCCGLLPRMRSSRRLRTGPFCGQ